MSHILWSIIRVSHKRRPKYVNSIISTMLPSLSSQSISEISFNCENRASFMGNTALQLRPEKDFGTPRSTYIYTWLVLRHYLLLSSWIFMNFSCVSSVLQGIKYWATISKYFLLRSFENWSWSHPRAKLAMQLPVLLGNYDKPTDPQTGGLMGEVTHPINSGNLFLSFSTVSCNLIFCLLSLSLVSAIILNNKTENWKSQK